MVMIKIAKKVTSEKSIKLKEILGKRYKKNTGNLLIDS